MIRLALLLFLTTSPVVAQSTFERYEREQKHRATALAQWLFIPGGGNFYAGDIGLGILFGGIDVAMIAIMTSSDLTSGESAAYGFLFVLIRGLELSLAFNSVDAFNADLRASLKLSHNSVGVNLSVHL